jgi:aminopeptidase
VKDVRLEFKNGRLLLEKTTAGQNGDALRASFEESEEIDKGKFDPVRTSNLAELGIGFNPSIRKAIGYVLTDEKVIGTVHLAFGANNTFGGTSESTMHWDFVTAPGVNIDVERVDGKTVGVMAKGRFV